MRRAGRCSRTSKNATPTDRQKETGPAGSPQGRWLPRSRRLLLQQQPHSRAGLVGRQRGVPSLARGLSLAHESRGLLELGRAGRLKLLTARRLKLLTARRLKLLTARRLKLLTARRLELLTARRLKLLAARRLKLL